jgi:adenylyl cyclase-associated protein
MSQALADLVTRLEKVAQRLEQGSSQAAPSSNSAPLSSGDDNPSLDGYDEILSGSFQTFVSGGRAIGGDLAAGIDMVEKAFNAQRAFLEIAAKSKQPSTEVLQKLLANTSAPLMELQSYRENSRRSEQFNHLSALSEGIPALSWVGVAPKPAPFVKEMKDAAMFYTNRILKDFRETDPKQADWAKSWVAVLNDLHDFIKRVHTTGLVWSANGQDASQFVGATPAPATKPAAKPAAPKPTTGDAGAKAGLFAALNKGGDITSGLKKVEKSQMTHKNPELRASSVVKSGAVKSAPAPAKKFGAPTVQKDPVLELQGKKWIVEYQRDNNNIVIEETNMKQTVYIYKCERSTIVVKGKVNSITLDGCQKVGICFDNALATFEVINCQSVQVQVVEKVPTVSIDKTDGCQLYLSKDSLETEIVTAKSSEMNVLIPKGEEGDFTEMAMPEQYKTTIKDGALVTEPTDIAG